jgi:hypothetical protein
MKSFRSCFVAACTAGALSPALWADVGTWGEFSGELLRADDISLVRGTAAARLVRGDTEFTFTVAKSAVAFDYQPAPFDFRGQSLTRDETSTALRSTGQHRFGGGTATALFSFGGYRGYTSYRSAWLDEYYRQQYAGLGGTPGLDTFRTAAPRGHDGSLGARWEYVRGSAFAQLTAGWAQDRVSPGYEIDFIGLRRTPDTLATSSVTLSLENVLTRRLRSRVELRTAETSGRERRFGIESELRVALGEQWIARAHAGAAREEPTFRAHFGGLAVERELGAGFSAFVEGRLYRDTGEIENALLFSSAAPGLRTRSLGVGVRHDGERWSGRLAVGRLRTDFAPTNLNTDFFRHLYRDRDWLTLEAAGSVRF